MYCTKSVCSLVRRPRITSADGGDHRGWSSLRSQWHRSITNEVPVQKGQGADGGREAPIRLCSSPVLQDDGVRGPGHGVDIGVLESSHSGVGRKGVQEGYLVEGPEVRQEADHVIQKLRRKTIPQRTGFTGFPGFLARRPSEMAKEGVPGLGICLLYTSPSPRDLSTSRMPSSA